MNTKDMSFGEALDWMHNHQGQPVCAVGERNSRSRIIGSRLEYTAFGGDENEAWIKDNENLCWKFEHRWQVVEPKNRIEEAIERGMAEILGKIVTVPNVRAAMNNVVNTTLDEVVRIIKERDLEATAFVIRSLKVKE